MIRCYAVIPLLFRGGGLITEKMDFREVCLCKSKRGFCFTKYDSEKARKDEDIESNLSILAPCIQTWRALENGGVGGICLENL